MLTAPQPTNLQGLIRSLAALGSFIAIVLTIACLYWGRSVLIPVALAILLTFLLAPAVNWVQRRGVNRVAAVLIIVSLTGVFLAGLGWVVVSQVTGLAHDLRHDDEYKKNITKKIDDLRGAGKGGFFDNLQATLNEITATPPSAEGTPKSPFVVQAQSPSPFPTIQAVLEPLVEPLAAAGLVVVLVIFMLLKYDELRNRLVGLFGESRLTVTTKALADAGERISRYLLMQLVVNGTYGLAIGIGLLLIGVPYAFLWGFLAAVLRYVPYIGPWLAALFPIATSLVASDRWLEPILVIALFLVCELVSNMAVEPLLYGQSIGVSEVALLVATGFWTWLWGAIGLVLATPLTVCLIVLGRYVPALRLFDLLLSDTPPLDAAANYYQRLLAGDQEEATEMIEEFVRTNEAENVYDEVLIPALLLARQDRKQESLSVEDEAFILEATREIVDDLAPDETTKPLVAPSPAGDGQPLANGAREADRLPKRIVACAAHHEAEELILHMLQHVMRPAGFEVDVTATKTLASEVVSQIREITPALIFIAVLPGGLPQARYLCKYLRNEFPDQHIVVGYWGRKEDFDKVLVRLRQAGAGYLTTSLLQSRSRIVSLTEAASSGPVPVEKSKDKVEAGS